MKRAGNGDTVKVHYTGKFDDGTVFDSSREREPLEFTIGKGQLIKGFEEAVDGLAQGEKATVKIPPEKAYGQRREELVIRIGREQFPPTIEPKEGIMLNIRHPSGGLMEVSIVEVNDSTVTMDANHPLAGKDLTFEIELVEVV